MEKIKVALVTSGLPHCGIAEYGKNLMKHLPEVEWTVIPHNDFRNVGGARLPEGCEIVHVNYEPGLFPSLENWWAVGPHPIKTVLTLHTSHEGLNASKTTDRFDRVVVHESCEDLFRVRYDAPRHFVFIPMGIPDLLSDSEKDIADAVREYRKRDIVSVGFPFPWKGFPEVSEAAARLGKECLFILPPGHVSAEPIVAECEKRNHGRNHYITGWFDERDTIKLLYTGDVAVFAYHGGNSGISGAVRLALAAELPTIVTGSCRQFRDLRIFEDEIEFVDSPDPGLIAQGIQNVMETGKRPKRILDEMSWRNSARQYYQLYEELLNGRRVSSS